MSNVCVLLCYVTVLVSMCVCHVYLINYLLTYLLTYLHLLLVKSSNLLSKDLRQLRNAEYRIRATIKMRNYSALNLIFRIFYVADVPHFLFCILPLPVLPYHVWRVLFGWSLWFILSGGMLTLMCTLLLCINNPMKSRWLCAPILWMNVYVIE